jgi:hypothetical protein
MIRRLLGKPIGPKCFDFFNDGLTEHYLWNMWRTVEKLNLWDDVRKFNMDRYFNDGGDLYLKMKKDLNFNDGHTGSSFYYCLRHMKEIGDVGFDKYRERLIKEAKKG